MRRARVGTCKLFRGYTTLQNYSKRLNLANSGAKLMSAR